MFLDILAQIGMVIGAGLILIMGLCIAAGIIAVPFMMLDVLMDLSLSEKVTRWLRGINWRRIIAPHISQAYVAGYEDMARALSAYTGQHGGYYHTDTITVTRKGAKLDESKLRRLASRAEAVREFDPAKGRSSDKYMAGSGKAWQEYHRGGMKLLADVDDMQAKVMEEERTIAIRQEGLSPLDAQYQASKRELDRLRDKTFAKVDDHRAFDAAMKDVEPRQA